MKPKTNGDVMNPHLLLIYLDQRRHPVVDREPALDLHRHLCEASPQLYLKLLADQAAHPSHLRLGLLTLLTHPAAREQISVEQLVEQLRGLAGDAALEALEALSVHRLNGRRARRAGLALLLAHPLLTRWAATRRRRLMRLLRHLLGERSFAAVGRALAAPASSEVDQRYLRRTVLRHAADPELARQALCFVTGAETTFEDPQLARAAAARVALEQGQGLPLQTLMGLRGTYFRQQPKSDVIRLSAVAPAAAQQTGPLCAAFLAALQGPGARLAELQRAEVEAARGLPRGLAGQLAVVLDLSASMASSGERRFFPAALAMALTRLLQGIFERVTVHQSGGSRALVEHPCPAPYGSSDLASALLNAARLRPEMVVLISDGYENLRQGDVAQLLRGMRRLGLVTPLLQVVTSFTRAEQINGRLLDRQVPALALWREWEVRELAARVLLARAGETELSETLQRLLSGLLCAA